MTSPSIVSLGDKTMEVTDRVLRAKLYALEAHGDQMYGPGLPYEYHLQSVVNELIAIGVSVKEVLMAGWLHDTEEDTSKTIRDLETEFGWEVAWTVWCVSNGPGKNRAARHATTYPKICSCEAAVVVKLADRVANMRASLGSAKKKSNSHMLKMYLKEADGFRKGVNYVRSGKYIVWATDLRRTLTELEEEGRRFLKKPQV